MKSGKIGKQTVDFGESRENGRFQKCSFTGRKVRFLKFPFSRPSLKIGRLFPDLGVLGKFHVFALLLCLLILTSCASAESSGKRQERVGAEELRQFQACINDADCVAVRNGCCDCANGGQDVAVSKNKLQAFEGLFDCGEVMCTMLARIPACLTGTVSCKDSLCHYQEPAAENPPL